MEDDEGAQIGVPYGKALEEPPYGVECPVCGRRFYDVDEGQETAEDAITKGSTRRYADHYVEEHGRKEP